MTGLVIVTTYSSYAIVIEDILIIAECTEPPEWKDRIEFVPL